MTTIDRALKDIGLTKTETEVYLALVKTSGAQPASVIANKLKMNRTTVYKNIVSLCKMGLVIKTSRQGILCFYTDDPENDLKKLVKEKQNKLTKANRQIEENIPFLKTTYTHPNPPKIDYYEGLRGVIQVYEDTLLEQDTILAFEDVASMDDEIKHYLSANYIKRRTQKGLFAYVVAPKNKDNVEFQGRDKDSMRETRLIDKMPFGVGLEFNIYGPKIAFFCYKPEEMFAIIIKNQTIADSMRAIFNVCWEMAK